VRLVIVALLAAVAVGPVAAQQYMDPSQPQPRPVQPKPKPKPPQAPKPAAAAAEKPKPAAEKPKPADEFEKPKLSEEEEKMRQRLILKERFNKGWDVTVENSKDRIEGKCKNEAKKKFSVMHPIKRRKFVKECIEEAAKR